MTRVNELFEMAATATDDCIIWPYNVASHGYPTMSIPGNRGATGHVLVCERHHGPRPSASHVAAHFCFVKRCVNPRHLRWATRSENTLDDDVKHLSQPGESHPRAKLTNADVIEIRRRYASGEVPTSIAADFPVEPATVSNIAARRVWKHI